MKSVKSDPAYTELTAAIQHTELLLKRDILQPGHLSSISTRSPRNGKSRERSSNPGSRKYVVVHKDRIEECYYFEARIKCLKASIFCQHSLFSLVVNPVAGHLADDWHFKTDKCI